MDRTMYKHGFSQISVELLDKELTPIQVYEQLNKKNIVVLESKAYFEAYYYNLKILKEVTEIPLSKIIIELDFSDIRPPPYLTRQYQQIARDSVRWDRTFDQSQRQAVLSCFDRSVTVIQGPPGTGKTYIGAKIFSILLNIQIQRQQYYYTEGNPIYLVCYTNNALDQFLEKIEEYTTEIIRLGGRSKIERFKQYSLHQRCMMKKFKRRKQFYKLKDEANLLLDQYQRLSCQIQHYIHLKIIHPIAHSQLWSVLQKQYSSILEEKIAEAVQCSGQQAGQHLRSSQQQIRRVLKYPEIFHWLGVFNFDYLQEITEAEEQNYEEEKFEYWGKDQYDEYDNYVEAIHSENTQHQKRIIQQICEMAPPILNQRFETLEQEISARFQHYLPQLTETERLDFKEHFPEFPYQLSMPVRWLLNIYLVEQEQEKIKTEMEQLVNKIKNIQLELDELDSEQSVRALESVRVVAMTTTGAAKYKHILKQVASQILIVEEAAQVLEAHITTALTPSTQQLILIGDHQQLRPSTSVYELAKNYHLDVSMFQRLVMKKGQRRLQYPCVTLTHQRRMRPQISEIVKIIYPRLQDSPSVYNRPHIRGVVGDSIYFMNHSYKEETDQRILSKRNPKQAELLLLFARYLIQQSYSGKQITILSLYTAQLFYMRDLRLKKFSDLEGMREIAIVTVDNFQGQENDIILLSLVRNNANDEIGFLKVSNRVCVALSRAREGLYMFGSATCLRNAALKKSREEERQEQLWLDVIVKLKEKDVIGDQLTLNCENHGTLFKIEKIEDFRQIPDGRCQEICNMEMGCGHKCKLRCHLIIKTEIDPHGHSQIKCKMNCIRNHGCGHACKYLCFQCKSQKQLVMNLKKYHFLAGTKNLLSAINQMIEMYCQEYNV